LQYDEERTSRETVERTKHDVSLDLQLSLDKEKERRKSTDKASENATPVEAEEKPTDLHEHLRAGDGGRVSGT